jgi:hypothetical protein
MSVGIGVPDVSLGRELELVRKVWNARGKYIP